MFVFSVFQSHLKVTNTLNTPGPRAQRRKNIPSSHHPIRSLFCPSVPETSKRNKWQKHAKSIKTGDSPLEPFLTPQFEYCFIK